MIPPKSLADIVESLIAIYYIDCGVIGALRFLLYCDILCPQIINIRRELDPLRFVLTTGQEDQIDKLKRRKLTPINCLVLESSEESIVCADSGDHTGSSDSFFQTASIRQAQSIQVTPNQKINNVLPYAPTFSSFPFPTLESLLHHPFKNRELLFMACTHSSLDGKLSNERLEWIGDAAIDWIVCRHYWYNYRLTNERISSVNAPTHTHSYTHTNTNYSLDHSSSTHIPQGHLPLSPESLTNSRQSAINNEAFARLVVKLGLHRFLRINSPHLQIEIERFAKEVSFKEDSVDNSNNNTVTIVNTNNSNYTGIIPKVLNQLQTHVSLAAPKVLGDLFEALMGALLLDTNLDIEHFSACFHEHFLENICSDPADLPTNAIQETLHLYAKLGVPRNQIVFTYREIGTDRDEDQRCLGVICQVWVKERCVAEAEGSNKQVAKKLAMEQALKELLKK